MNAQQLIYEYLSGDFLAGDAFLCLQLAVSLQDSKKAAQAGLRCYDLARHLEAKHKKAAPVEFKFDERSLRSVDELREQGVEVPVLPQTPPDSYYTWGGARYKISADRVYQWNSLAGEWQLSTMLPKHLREDGTEVSAAAIIFSEAAQ